MHFSVDAVKHYLSILFGIQQFVQNFVVSCTEKNRYKCVNVAQLTWNYMETCVLSICTFCRNKLYAFITRE